MSYFLFTVYIVLLTLPRCSFGFSEEYHSSLKDDTVALTYFKKVGSDSAHIYFTDDFKFTEASCARIVRYTPLSEKGFQTGVYKDYRLNKRVIGTGGYQNSLRHGLFETFYEDGKIKSQGKFIEDIPDSVWSFFEPDGSLKRQIDFVEKKVNVLSASLNEKKIVKNGNGKFKGSFFSIVLNEEMYASGRVYNGLMEGKWKVWRKDMQSKGQVFSTEYFNNGKFVLGSLNSSGNRFQREYLSKSIITLLEPEYYFLIEQGKVISCEELNMKKPELVFIDIGQIKSLVNQQVRRQQSIKRSIKTEQVYTLVIDKDGKVISIEKVSVEDVFQLDDELKKALSGSRWKSGQNSQGPATSKVSIVIEFNPSWGGAPFDITTRVE